MSEPAPRPRDASVPAYRSILAVASFGDHDDDALRLAVRLANANGARLALLGIEDDARAIADMVRHAGLSPDEVARWRSDTLRERLHALAEAAGVPTVEIEVRLGKPFLEVIREVEHHGHDLVVKAAARVEGVGGYLFRSTDQHLVRKCPAPVLLSVPQAGQKPGPVVAAIDADEENASEPQAQVALNDRIVALTRTIAAAHDAPALTVSAWDAPAEALARRWFNDDGNVASYVRGVEGERRSALREIIARSAAADSRQPIAALERGRPREVVPSFVAAREASLLVIGTIARTGLSGFLIGNTAEDVLNTVTCSVLAVKPEGFVAPVH